VWAFAAGWRQCGVEQSRYTATPNPANPARKAKKSLLR
jgi:hypothetical protein